MALAAEDEEESVLLSTTNPAATEPGRSKRTAAVELAKTGFVGKERQQRWCRCGDGRASVRSFNGTYAVLSVNGWGTICSMNAAGCALTVNGVGSIASFNSIFSVYSGQSALSVNSLNCFACFNSCNSAFAANIGCGETDGEPVGAGGITTVNMGLSLLIFLAVAAVCWVVWRKWKQRRDGPARFAPDPDAAAADFGPT